MSNMVVRTNVFALNAHRNLTNVGLKQRQAAQRLSSGFRVNSAADDAAGLAISESMRAQIRGLDQASINTQDGVGLIQTAEGAMATVSDMVIRIRELMVQAANDTYTVENREMIQLEIDQLMTEINDVTFRTEFNTKTLLDGGLTGGGGPTSAVSLQWMNFQQARVIGFGVPGGEIGPNERDRNSLRQQIINLQDEMNDLIERIARRVANNGTTGDLDTDFRNVPAGGPGVGAEIGNLSTNMTSTERQQLQSIANRLNNLMRMGVANAEQIYQTTNDQIRALGGRNAMNNDGTSVFISEAMDTWFEQGMGGGVPVTNGASEKLAFLQAFRNIDEPSVPGFAQGTVFNNGVQSAFDGQLQPMFELFRDLVGYTTRYGDRLNDVASMPAMIPNPDFVPAEGGFYNATTGNRVATQPPDRAMTAADHTIGGLAVPAGYTLATAPVIRYVHSVTGNQETAVTDRAATAADMAPGSGVTLPPGYFFNVATGQFYDDIDFTSVATPMLNAAQQGYTLQTLVPAGQFYYDDAGVIIPRAPMIDYADQGYVDTGDPFVAAIGSPTIPNPALIPTSTDATAFLNHLEQLLDGSMTALATVNLESNALWFQIGANTMQGTILQLKGIHTGVLGGNGQDLATLIDVRQRHGEDISAQLEYIDNAETIVNQQRAQLGAVQNRLEFTRQSLDVSSENLSAAESRIRDTDMAREMMRFTQAQVLQQAGISMLAQANQLPASILQLLQ